MAATSGFRKTRFVCISDTHNTSPRDGCFRLPAGDVLIHAGDLTNQGTLGELRDTLDWIEAAEFEVKIVVAGNHDITLDPEFYEKNAERFHSRYPQSSAECRALLGRYPTITYLEHESATVHLSDASGPPTSFTVFASPYSPTTGRWAFGYESLVPGKHQAADATNEEQNETTASVMGNESELLWSAIPTGTDVLITHTPPMGHCDAGRDDRSCEALRHALRRVRPRVSVCGHIHEGWGAEIINWEQEASNLGPSGNGSHIFDLPKDGKKLAKIDLTRIVQSLEQNSGHASGYSEVEPRISGGLSENAGHSDAGQDSSNDKRTERPETCVINAAIMAHSRGAAIGGKKYNKPIVVELNLPVQ